MPDLAITGLAVEPEMADPGDLVTFSGSVLNKGRGDADSATLILLVDNVEIGRVSIGLLQPQDEKDFAVTWTASGPGRHWVVAQLEPGETVVEKSFWE